MAAPRTRTRAERTEAAPGSAAGGARARVLRRLHPGRARGKARTTHRYHQEQDVHRPRAPTRVAGRGRGDGMESLTMHDLTAAYALDALDADEAREYEEHLATCERCRADLAQLGGAASALAFAVESPAPPEALRSRILDAARAERPNVVPMHSRWTGDMRPVAAVGLGIWALSLSRSLDRERSARARVEQLLADPDAARVRVSGKTTGTLVVARNGEAALIVSKLDRAPSGSVYEAWVIHNGKPLRAATFAGGGKTALVGLERRVPPDSLVAVTLERKPGAATPHGKILLHSQTV